MKRIFELSMSDVKNMKKSELINTIKYSEGRTVMAETVIANPPLIGKVSNPELAAAFGADMITLNFFDFNCPIIWGIDDINIDASVGLEELHKGLSVKAKENFNNKNYIRDIKHMVGRLIGVNIEPVPEGSNYFEGRTLTESNLNKIKEYGFDYIVITGNPNTGVTTETIIEGVKKAKAILGNEVIIIAGKMHGAGGENIYDQEVLKEFVKSGADVVLIPAVGTVPGVDANLAKDLIDAIHEAGGLAMTAIGTSQEGAQKNIIENIAIMCKAAGADIQHIGDAGYAGIALPENIMTMSIAVRGVRHTYRRIAYSINK